MYFNTGADWRYRRGIFRKATGLRDAGDRAKKKAEDLCWNGASRSSLRLDYATVFQHLSVWVDPARKIIVTFELRENDNHTLGTILCWLDESKWDMTKLSAGCGVHAPLGAEPASCSPATMYIMSPPGNFGGDVQAISSALSNVKWIPTPPSRVPAT
jgi:hypothetical protein